MSSQLSRSSRLFAKRASTAALAGIVLLGACSVFPDHAELASGGGAGRGGDGGNPEQRGGHAGEDGGSSGRQQGGASGSTSGSSSGGEVWAGEGGGGSPTDGGTGASGATSGGSSDAGNGGSGGEALGGTTGEGGSGGEAQGGTTSDAGSGNSGEGGGSNCATTQLIPDHDASLSESEPKKNFGSTTSLFVSGVSGARANAALGFNFAPVPSGRVARATLSVLVNSRSGADDADVSIFALTQGFDEARANWTIAATGNAKWSTPGGDVALSASSTVALGAAGPGDHLTFDITKDVAAVLSGSSNHGWLISVAPSDVSLELGARELTAPGQSPTLEVETCP